MVSLTELVQLYTLEFTRAATVLILAEVSSFRPLRVNSSIQMSIMDAYKHARASREARTITWGLSGVLEVAEGQQVGLVIQPAIAG